MPSLKHISRIEQASKKNFCWKLALQRNKIKHIEYFPDKRYGGKDQSLSAALKRREEILRQLPPPLTMRNQLTRRNKTGKVGVRLATQVDRRTPKPHHYEAYIASWSTKNGKRASLHFSCKKYGQEKAFKLACISRNYECSDRSWIEEKYQSNSES